MGGNVERHIGDDDRDGAAIEALQPGGNGMTHAARDVLAERQRQIERMTKELDEARAQVAAAYELAAQAKVLMAEEGGFLTRVPLLPETKAAIRALTPADAQAALEAYGREKVREGMQRAVDLYPQGIAAILAEMEKLK